ncbi:dihydrolipoyl dehydrogenase family protein [Brachybacterium muris]|uniref:Pyridine nucleotide-disulfide oxidoreductase n=1 Tax=Brachybacterium muris UCD-AY4 TaxID=1249481 RepID=A0A022KXX4_9MICO|nr:NAD(P)/FAD-dependent oxidoreductase [Brachybacterium muris]EYT49392.1 pyridine nucleotide-disulfide oxidoreductase [Brachybacterium muris UCD-AY4]PZO61182.1 MAG: NAD(P)/FAD-dependent oxidoreductase [Pseudoxanthomonas suwonensis]
MNADTRDLDQTTDEHSEPDGTDTYDVVVIGGGPVGENVAQYAIEGTDLTAVIVEQELVGGECSYYACMPSKALLRPLAVADASAHLEGISTSQVEVEGLLARRDTWVSDYDDAGQVDWAEGAGIDVVRGRGRLVGEREVEVTGPSVRRLRARRAVVLATGSDPQVPGPLREIAPWGSRDVTGVQEVPERLLIVGGGVVAVEAATWMAALGSRVTMLVRGDSLLSGFEPCAGRHVAEALEKAGVEVQLGASTVEATRTGTHEHPPLGRPHGGEITVVVEDSDGRREVRGDELLAATGRAPRLEGLGLDALGLSADDVTGGDLPGWLHVVGDASGEAPLTHWGKYRARELGARLRSEALAATTGEDAPVDAAPPEVPVPQVVFTDPQVASVGLTEQEAREKGRDVTVAEVPFGSAAGSALLRDDVVGTAKLVVDADSRTLLGATFVGPDAGEQLHAATIAIVGQVPVHVLRHAVPSYPAVSELWLRLLEELPREFRTAPPL